MLYDFCFHGPGTICGLSNVYDISVCNQNVSRWYIQTAVQLIFKKESKGQSRTTRRIWAVSDWGRPHIHICPILPTCLRNTKIKNQKIKTYIIFNYTTKQIWAGSSCFRLRAPSLSYQSNPPQLPPDACQKCTGQKCTKHQLVLCLFFNVLGP